MEEGGVKVDDRLSERLGLQGWVLLEPHPMGQEQSVAGAPSTLPILNVQTGLCCHLFYGVGMDSPLVPPSGGFSLSAIL